VIQVIELPLYQVDAFTDRPFAGNPAAVCLLDTPLPVATMQAVATELNLSETAFVQALYPGDAGRFPRYSLRWFTPEAEVQLCGHATLATAAVLFEEFGVVSPAVEFDTLSGILVARRTVHGILLDFPADPPEPYTLHQDVATALGAPAGARAMRSPRLGMVLVEYGSADAIARLRPDMRALAASGDDSGGMGYIVTAPGRAPVDFVSRFFAPGLGVDEDPVTGSSHTVLGPYWSKKLGKNTMIARQMSARGGDLTIDMLPNGRVGITGRAVVVFKGMLRLAL
jgi:PhzF family phenazine biosynthesis protein